MMRGADYAGTDESLCYPDLVRGGNDADEAAATALVLKLDVAGDEREQRVVLALPDVFAGLMSRAALANDDRARVDELPAKTLYAEPLTVRIAAVC